MTKEIIKMTVKKFASFIIKILTQPLRFAFEKTLLTELLTVLISRVVKQVCIKIFVCIRFAFKIPFGLKNMLKKKLFI